MYDRPLDLVVAGQNRELSGRADENMTVARPGPAIAQRGTLPQDMLIKQEDIQTYKEIEYNLSIYSADRKWELAPTGSENRFNFSVNLYSGNPTNGLSIMPKGAARFRNIVRIEFVKAVIPIEVTEMIIRKVSNLTNPDYLVKSVIPQVIAGTNSTASIGTVQETAISTGAINILRHYESIVGNTTAGTITGSPTVPPAIPFVYDTTLLKNIYAYPFITLNVDELDTNNYGTNNSMDNAFGILQYDSNWTDNTNSLGFTSLIPKHMKCQRVYSPTPLATLNKLTIRLQQPNGELVNSTSDTLDISGIVMSGKLPLAAYFSNTVDIGGTPFYDDGECEYIFLDCKNWFNRYQYAVGDKIQIRNLTSVTKTPAMIDLLNYIQRAEGHTIVGTAYTQYISPAQIAAVSIALFGYAPGSSVNPAYTINVPAVPGVNTTSVNYTLNDGCNPTGYSRFIVIRARFSDPTINGSNIIQPYGGDSTNYNISQVTNTIKAGRLINLSRQTQFIFRIITREYDSGSLVRPDNL
jgi:hypothetical protein